MDTRILEMVLTEQAEEMECKKALKFCDRMEESLVNLDSTQAQVVIGVRRSGKSTLCFNVLKKAGVKYAYANFDDERLAELKGSDLNNVLEVLYKIHGDFNYLFIDEIQNIPEWYLFVNRLLRTGMHILVTGSNAKLLSGELASHLTGRHNPIPLYPFSFAEYCEFRNVDTKKLTTQAVALRRAAFDDYLKQGGFPEVQSLPDTRGYITALVDSILKRDIEQRFKVVYKAAFELMAHHLLNVVPAIVSDRALQADFGFKSEHTSRNYVGYLKQAYLLTELHKFSYKSSLRVIGEKLYPIDVALMNNRPEAMAADNLGWRLETVVYLELQRRCRQAGLDIYYFSDRSGECDFLLCRDRAVLQAVQVSYDILNPKTRRRELSGLRLAARRTGCKELLLLTDHEYEDIAATEDCPSISVRPVYDWLLHR